MTILYVPAEGDPYGVLADGMFGAKMPRVAGFVTDTPGVLEWGPAWAVSWPMASPVALPLVWKGEDVPEAVDRLERCLAKAVGKDVGDVRRAGYDTRQLADLAAFWLGGRVEVV